jgi:hypothetical protein
MTELAGRLKAKHATLAEVSGERDRLTAELSTTLAASTSTREEVAGLRADRERLALELQVPAEGSPLTCCSS